MKTEFIVGGRGSGKSTELIKRSATTGQYIMVANKQRAKFLFERARRVGLIIPFPVTIHELLDGSTFRSSRIRRDGLLIDDFDDVIAAIFSGVQINAVTMTEREYNITRIGTREVENNEN